MVFFFSVVFFLVFIFSWGGNGYCVCVCAAVYSVCVGGNCVGMGRGDPGYCEIS